MSDCYVGNKVSFPDGIFLPRSCKREFLLNQKQFERANPLKNGDAKPRVYSITAMIAGFPTAGSHHAFAAKAQGHFLCHGCFHLFVADLVATDHHISIKNWRAAIESERGKKNEGTAFAEQDRACQKGRGFSFDHRQG